MIISKKIIFWVYYFIIFLLSVNGRYSDKFKTLYEYDKTIHFIQYFILVLLGIIFFKIKASLKNFLIIILFIIISSAIAELIQLYIPERDSNLVDFFYNIAGGISAMLVFIGVKLCCKN